MISRWATASLSLDDFGIFHHMSRHNNILQNRQTIVTQWLKEIYPKNN